CHTKEKWTKYFLTKKEMGLISGIKKDKRFVRLSDLALINVGITTGNNDYFSIDKKTENEYNLSGVSLPLLGRSSHAHGIFFTNEDWQKNVDDGKKAMLVNFPDIPIEEYDGAHKTYILKGEKAGQNAGYKCSIRDRWYIVPSVWVPDAFFLRRNNLYPKFVLNKCNAVSTDTMHRIKFNPDVDPETLLIGYYNSVSFAFVEICGRSYGGGVLEILPGEAGNIIVPAISGLRATEKKMLIEKIDEVVRSDDDIELALDLVDKAILIDILGLEEGTCQRFRRIWKKMQARRLKRSGKDGL
ncbi:MAG: class I SAM-dependent methyltransferase, partial [Clostridiales bacterium]|nr:class I SAM-dependent methyltransferase [Clostridiales bacterium]